MSEGETKKARVGHPLPETRKHLRPISEAQFKSILKRAITTPVRKPAPK